MGRLVRILLLVVAGFVGLTVIAAVALFLFFDPNDFRDEISAQVKSATGRDLVIEGDLSLSVFPWIAVNIGRTQLGNAEGFGDDPFLSFEEARLSVRLAPLLFQQTVTIGTASLDSFALNRYSVVSAATPSIWPFIWKSRSDICSFPSEKVIVLENSSRPEMPAGSALNSNSA